MENLLLRPACEIRILPSRKKATEKKELTGDCTFSEGYLCAVSDLNIRYA